MANRLVNSSFNDLCSRVKLANMFLASATPIHRGGPMKGKPKDFPDHPPPSGYVCYRCGEKGEIM